MSSRTKRRFQTDLTRPGHYAEYLPSPLTARGIRPLVEIPLAEIPLVEIPLAEIPHVNKNGNQFSLGMDQTPRSRFIRMRVFRGVKNGRAVPTGNALALQRSIFRVNRLKSRPSSDAEKVSILCGTNNHVKSELLSNRHTHTDIQTHRPSTVTLAAYARRGLTSLT